jgi:hypothetical protein
VTCRQQLVFRVNDHDFDLCLQIYRIQNPFLLKRFQQMKAHLSAQYEAAGKRLEERLLYHGTSLDRVKKIAEENFDWRRSGEVNCRKGNFYGHGAYFSNNPQHSHFYAKPDCDGVRYMFACQVLVGLVTKGKPDMRCLPAWSGDVNYDTAVNDVEKPWEYVKFDNSHYYPSYLIKYATETETWA